MVENTDKIGFTAQKSLRQSKLELIYFYFKDCGTVTSLCAFQRRS